MFFLLSFLWFIRQTKAILFWLYLWQLKEYHIGRFIDHFRTDKGKRLMFNRLLIFKILLVLIFLYGFFIFNFRILPPPAFSPNISLYFFEFFVRIPFLIFILYIFEAAHASFGFFRKKIKNPVLTKKTITLILATLILKVLFLGAIFLYVRGETGEINSILAAFYLLLFDVLTPIITSAIVLFFQPLAVLGRSQIIRKAKQKREKFKNLIVVGVTGSYGKTSTKEFLATILSEKFKVLKTAEHQNSEVGISRCILNELKPEHEIFIVEMGAYNRGGIKLLCDIAKPQHGILTGINEQHMATQGSLENIINTKYELVESLPGLGFVVFNGDNEYCRGLYKEAQISKRICYTKFSAVSYEVVAGDYWTKEIKAEKDLLSFKVFSRWGEIVQFRVNLLGEHWAQNILMAAIVAKEVMGMSLEEIAAACQKITPEQAGTKLIKGFNDLDVIDATYSANPEGVIAHLEYLNVWPGKKIIVMPCLIELGDASKEVHRRIGQKIGEVCDLAIITTKERFEEIKEGMPNSVFLENPEEIFRKIKKFCNQGDVVLLEGRVPDELKKILMR